MKRRIFAEFQIRIYQVVIVLNIFNFRGSKDFYFHRIKRFSFLQDLMLWSQIIRPAAGRIVRFLIIFLDIVRCPVNFRYYFKFHGARTAFGRVIEGKITSAEHRTVPGWRPAGVFTHRTGTGRFLFNIYIVRFQRRPSRHRTVLGWASYDV